ncbi:MAG: hypothetical protein ACU0CO_01320 [Shimia sp.]
MSERMDIAVAAWGTPPDWIVALVRACDETSQNRCAVRLGFSAAVISQTIRRTYAGQYDNVEKRVRAILLSVEIACPAIGPISSADCLRWQDEAETLTSGSPVRVRMFKACRACARFRGTTDA